MQTLPPAFFDRPCAAVSRDLLGHHVVHGDVVVRVSEVEAYCGPTDSASHARHGRTERNAVLWQGAGRAYVYLCYGLHQMLNITCAPGEALLVRAGAVVRGLDVVLARRGPRATPGAALLAGPGRLAQGLGIDRSHNGHDLCAGVGLSVAAGVAVDDDAVGVGPRVGIDFAAPRDRDALLRFVLQAGPRTVPGTIVPFCATGAQVG